MITRQRSSGSELVVPGGADAQRKRSIEDTLAASQVIGAVTVVTDDDDVKDAKTKRNKRSTSGLQGENDQAYAVNNPLFKGNAGTNRQENARPSLTDDELQQVLGHSAAHANGPSSNHMVTASNSGATVVGSSISLGSRTNRSVTDAREEDLREFRERVKRQPTATYVPIECAGKILEKAATDAEEAESRHRDVVVQLEVAYRAINEKTKSHYEGLILRFQSEVRTELRRLEKERKDLEDLVENLRDKIASLTAAAAAQERRHAAMRERDNVKREQEAANFRAVKAELVNENLRAVAAVEMDAKQSAEREATSRAVERRRRSMQRVELEDKVTRATVSLALESTVRTIENQEENQNRASLADRVSTFRTEADQLRNQLGEALMNLETQREETDRVIKERDDDQAESLTLKADNASLREKLLDAQHQYQALVAAGSAVGSGDADEKTTTPTEPMNMTVLSVKEVADQEEVAGSTNPSAGDTPDSSENQLVQTGTGPRSEAAVTVVAAPPSEVEKAEELRAELKATTADKKKVKTGIKEWIKEFEEREGRPPTNGEKSLIRDKFVDLKRLEKQSAKLTNDLQELEAVIESNISSTGEGARGGESALTTLSSPNPAAEGSFEKGRRPHITSDITSSLETLREDNASLRDKLATSDGDGGQHQPGNSAQTQLPEMAAELEEAKAAVAKQQKKVLALTESLEKSEKKKMLLETALRDFTETATKMLGDAPPAFSEGATASAGNEEPLKAELKLETTLARLQKECTGSATATEEELKKSLQTAKDEARDAALAAKKSDLLREEATAALQAARAEVLSCQLVVDEASEAARLRKQVAALKGDLEAKSRDATSGWQAAATAESKVRSFLEAITVSSATFSSSELPSPSEAVDGRTAPISAASADTTAGVTGADVAGGSRGGTSATEGNGARDQADGGLSAGEEVTCLANELDTARRELDNLRERERDARGEADGLAEEAERSRVRHERQREREAELISTLARLEEEKETLSRGLVMAQERAALAMELVEAHTEEAAKARQESALNAAKFRRVSRVADQAAVAAAVASAGADTTAPEKSPKGKSPSAANRRIAEQLRVAAATLIHAIKEGTDLWRRNRREECHALYAKAGARAAAQMPPGQALDDLRIAMTAAKGMAPVKAAVALRKAFDTVVEAALVAKENLAAQRNATRADGSDRGTHVSSSRASAGDTGTADRPSVRPAASSDAVEATTDGPAFADKENSKVASLQRQLEALLTSQEETDKVAALAAQGGNVAADGGAVALKTSQLEVATKKCAELEGKVEDLEAMLGAGPVTKGGAVAAGVSASEHHISSLENKNKEEAAKTRMFEAQIAKLEAQATIGTARGESAGVKADTAKVKTLENKMKKATDEFERKSKKFERDLEVASKGWDGCKAELSDMRKERDALQKEVAAMGSMGEELRTLRAKADETARLQTELEEATTSVARIQKLYQDEQALRKKYWNMMEDMKGKIRVYTRCRPFAQYELDQKCKRAVRLIDETTVEVDAHHGAKQFVFDNVFSEGHSQESVFQETRNLVQSALDGFNVCVFAYGQTGSGKTWTMTGGKGEQRGLTPRVIEEIFAIIEKGRGSIEVHVSCYFVELYLDNLRDLFFAMDHSKETPPKLEIKLDANKMVVVKNVVTKKAGSAQELLHLFTQGNLQRKVGGTRMNAESSRSHSIFGILIEVYNRMTKKSTSGKFSLVDLAGSERADKTGATAERLKEAQSINKSLSALGDVISALSTNEKFVPYRNNKLTQVMQDSLGGNAKTLMFVNISPADYNQEETATALTYASRVKLITNSAEKQQDGEEVARLKETIRRLKAGEPEVDGTVDG